MLHNPLERLKLNLDLLSLFISLPIMFASGYCTVISTPNDYLGKIRELDYSIATERFSSLNMIIMYNNQNNE